MTSIPVARRVMLVSDRRDKVAGSGAPTIRRYRIARLAGARALPAPVRVRKTI